MGTVGIILLKCLSSSYLRFIGLLSKSLNLMVARETKRVYFQKKMFNIFFIRNHKVGETDTLHTC